MWFPQEEFGFASFIITVKAITTQCMLRLILVPSPVNLILTCGDLEKLGSSFAKWANVIFNRCNIDCCTPRTFPGIKCITDLASTVFVISYDRGR